MERDEMEWKWEPAVGGLDGLVEGEKGGLEGGELDEELNGLEVGSATAVDLLAAAGEAGEISAGGGGGAVDKVLEAGELDAGNVVLLGPEIWRRERGLGI